MFELNVKTAIVIAMLGAGLTASAATSEFASYRGFQFGSSVGEAVKRSGSKPYDTKVIYKTPALIQEMEWRPSSSSSVSTGAAKADPVQEVRLRFYNDELFQFVSTYDYQKIEGLTEADLIDAISATYGKATVTSDMEIPYRTNYGETAKVIARWEDGEYSNSLVRTGDRFSYALILSSKRLDNLAQAAIREAIRVDALEAPQKAIDAQKSRDAEGRVALDKNRAINKPNFKP